MLGNSPLQASSAALLATVGAGTTDALWRTGELSLVNYLEATGVSAGIYSGSIGVDDGVRALNDIWMRPVDGDLS